jgi:hypothetical protein
MTHEPDIPERDPALDAAWREHSTELPSAALDAAILAAAHRAVGSAPKDASKVAAEATSPQRWWMPLAAAATIGAVALGILQTMPQQDSVTTPAVSDAPAPVRAPERASVAPSAPPPAPAKPAAKVIPPAATSATDHVAQMQSQLAAASEAQRAAAPAPQPFPAEKKAVSAESDVKDRARMAPKLAAAPEPAPAAAAPTAESARADVRERNEAQPSAPSAAGAVTLGKTAVRMDAAAAPAVDVDAWIARVRKLHDEGKLAEAAKELVAMRAAVPDADARLPRELRAWAATVKP